jgi:hypothetical protein
MNYETCNHENICIPLKIDGLGVEIEAVGWHKKGKMRSSWGDMLRYTDTLTGERAVTEELENRLRHCTDRFPKESQKYNLATQSFAPKEVFTTGEVIINPLFDALYGGVSCYYFAGGRWLNYWQPLMQVWDRNWLVLRIVRQ